MFGRGTQDRVAMEKLLAACLPTDVARDTRNEEGVSSIFADCCHTWFAPDCPRVVTGSYQMPQDDPAH